MPSEHEWQVLIDAVGGKNIAGKKLQSKSGNGTDEYGFSVLPAGYHSGGGSYYYAGRDAYFWSSTTEDGSYYAYRWGFYFGYANVGSNYDHKSRGFSVRCLRDSD
ncbi:FISUMP domain-containing protein [uncultured Fibrobacter sp.]|uniref:FISUMP domain-containing protein n=1 Tax=uncultured Fibrobacter sp. TaxID=261512 RepID=UPI002804C3B0|nr:FISUMP domain-containing protein [uncultured Fibrobacter sp.]